MTACRRVLAVDFGTVRIGLAVSDPDRKIASPMGAHQRRTRSEDAEWFRGLCTREDIAAILVGVPVHLSGREGVKAAEARTFGNWLGEVTGLPVSFWDERFTTVEAEQALLQAGLTRKRRKTRRDALAAQILLQSYLDAGCPAGWSPKPLEDG